MNRHRYLLAYMAGALLPTWFMLVLLCIFLTARFAYGHVEVERLVPFPMAVVPNLWGLWNLLFFAFAVKRRLSLGAWGALLPLILIPAGLVLTRVFDVLLLTPAQALVALPLLAGFYYLLWKHIVGYFNAVAGLG
jgi:hypothetical protein